MIYYSTAKLEIILLLSLKDISLWNVNALMTTYTDALICRNASISGPVGGNHAARVSCVHKTCIIVLLNFHEF